MLRKPDSSTITLSLGLLALAAALAPAPEPDDTGEVKVLAEAKVKAAQEILDLCKEFLVAPPRARDVPSPTAAAEEIQYWSRQLADARLETTDRRPERIAILTEEVERARGFAVAIKDLSRGEATGLTRLAAVKADFYRIDSEKRLAKEKAGP